MRRVLDFFAIACFALSSFAAESFKEVAPFPIGVGISDQIPRRPAEWPLLKSQFTLVTPENCMKSAAIQRQEGAWAFPSTLTPETSAICLTVRAARR
jgi:GH35 family endo-1,4-beta-xylanase